MVSRIAKGLSLLALCDLVVSEVIFFFLLESLLIGIWPVFWVLLSISNETIAGAVLIHPASASNRRRASEQILRIAIVCERVLGPVERCGRSKHFGSLAGCAPWQWMHFGGQMCPVLAAHRFL